MTKVPHIPRHKVPRSYIEAMDQPTVLHNFGAASVCERSKASDCISFKILLCIYISIYVCLHLAQADAAVVQAVMAIPCHTLHFMFYITKLPALFQVRAHARI